MKQVETLFGVGIYKSGLMRPLKYSAIKDEDLAKLKKTEADIHRLIQKILIDIFGVPKTAQEKPASEPPGIEVKPAAGQPVKIVPAGSERVGQIVSLKGRAGGSGSSKLGG